MTEKVQYGVYLFGAQKPAFGRFSQKNAWTFELRCLSERVGFRKAEVEGVLLCCPW